MCSWPTIALPRPADVLGGIQVEIIEIVMPDFDVFVSSTGFRIQSNATQSRPAGVHEWLRVVAIETAVTERVIFDSTTGHSNIIVLVHMEILFFGSTGKLQSLQGVQSPFESIDYRY